MSDEAKWLAKEVILPAIESLREDMKSRDEDMWKEIGDQKKCITHMKVDIQQLKGNDALLARELKSTRSWLGSHTKDKDLHFNPYFNETLGQRLKRKQPEILAGGGIGTGIVTLILAIMKGVGWL